ncbi:MAG: MFS transporter [Rhodospirillales bacterium]|nr:MFS transporter [Rhodospirillales bacterium]MDH3790969.1 MFS transporter [Rhodospirillales bacterium]MDH3913078.1 MFS transporter [Rhodospirillales bacterium]MDH3920398.1 MFS transporter [Rhodospirillales bacterium]MDH3969225.1 MFS transporter [Rhodospirillales bacterium]
MTSSSGASKPLGTAATALIVLGPFALGYFLSYLFRSVNAVVAPNLVSDIGLTAGELGLLTAAYLFAFAAFQLPLGLLLDRHGPRRVQAALLCCAAAGSLLFSLAEGAMTLTAARALIGLGFAGGLMSGFKAVVLWVPEPRRALANACVMAFGALGILVATVPVEIAVQAVGWRAVFLFLAAITLAVAALVFLVVPERSTAAAGGGFAGQIASLVRIYKDPAFWRLAPLLATSAGTHIGIQTLWSGPWFRDVAGFDRSGVATHLMYMAIAFLVGILLSGAVADWFVRRGVDLLTVMICFLLIFFCVELAIVLQWTSVTLLLWVVFGMTGQAAILAYPWLASYFGAELSGRANTAMNLLIFMSAFGVQYAIGEIIDLFPTTATGGYDPRGYQIGFGIFTAAQLLALIWFFLGRSRLKA